MAVPDVLSIYLLVTHLLETLLIIAGDILVITFLNIIWRATRRQDGRVLGLCQAPLCTRRPLHFRGSSGSLRID